MHKEMILLIDACRKERAWCQLTLTGPERAACIFCHLSCGWCIDTTYNSNSFVRWTGVNFIQQLHQTRIGTCAFVQYDTSRHMAVCGSGFILPITTSEGSGQPVRMRRLIWALAGFPCHTFQLLLPPQHSGNKFDNVVYVLFSFRICYCLNISEN